MRTYYTYILTNFKKTVLYVGITNNLPQRITEHYLDRLKKQTFAGKYECYYLLHFESFPKPSIAIKREKQIKGWTRNKKETLIAEFNTEWMFLNKDIMEWPPDKDTVKRGSF